MCYIFSWDGVDTMANEKILVVEDDQEIRDLVELCLNSYQFQPIFANDGMSAIEQFEQHNPDLILLDIMLPKIDGLKVCEEIRKYSNVPIVFMSCNNESSDVVKGLELGGDDYIIKPFDINVLIARIRSNLRRAPIFKRDLFQDVSPIDTSHQSSSTLAFGELEIDVKNYEAKMKGENISFSVKEIQLLILLAQNPNKLFSSEELYAKIWGSNSYGDTRTVNVHISNIRKKIEASPDKPKYIQNVRGLGYKFIG